MSQSKPQRLVEGRSIRNLTDVEMERMVLGTMLVSKDAVLSGMDVLNVDVFYDELNKVTFNCMRADYDQSGQFDLLTISQRARAMFPGSGVDAIFLMDLSGRVGSSANFDFHVKLIMELAMKRKLAEVTMRAYNELMTDLDADVFELQNKLIVEIESVSSSLIKNRERSIKEVVGEIVMQKQEQQRLGLEGIAGVTTGFDNLDALLGGWKPGRFVVLAARPGVGKSAFALSLAANAAELGKVPTVFFSLEMPDVELGERLLAARSTVFSNKIANADLNGKDWADINKAIGPIEKLPLYIDDTGSLQMYELKSKVRRLKHALGIGLVVVDYLQLMGADASNRNFQMMNREQVISAISRGLKLMAKDLNVPVIALAQLSRAVEQRGSKKPMLSDLRESGSIEQDADIVGFLWSDASDKSSAADSLEVQYINLTIAKHRGGRLHDLRFKFAKSYTKFTEVETDSPNPAQLLGHMPSVTVQQTYDQPPF